MKPKLETGLLMAVWALSAVLCHAQFSPAQRDYVQYCSRATHADYRYQTGEEAAVRLDVTCGGTPVSGVKVYARSGMEMMETDRWDTLTLEQGTAVIPAGTSDRPGFRVCSFSFTLGGKLYKETLKVGFSPEQIEPAVDLPADFASFWKQALREAEAVPLDPQLTPLPRYTTPEVEAWLVRLTVGPGHRTMYGYLTMPRDGKKHPVLFNPPGAGSNRISCTTYYAERGYIYFSVCIHDGLNPELPDEAFAAARKVADNYTFNGIGQPETFYYRSVYAGCARCMDFLCSLPQWDGINAGVTGGSQGGALTVVTAGLSPRVTFAAAFYPALCDLTGFLHQRAGGWPKYFQQDAAGHEAEARTLAYYDVVNFGRMVRCPLFLSYGYADDTCSPTSVTALRNAVTAPLTVAVTPSSAHWRFVETNDEAMAWQQAQLR